MELKSIKDESFRKYGRVVQNIDFGPLVEAMKSTPVPDGVVYEPSIPELEALPVKDEIQNNWWR